MKTRWLQNYITRWIKGKSARALIMTGARQVGKTTLAKCSSKKLAYINLDDPLFHAEFENMGGEEFTATYPCAIIDEIQKVPLLFDLVKYAIDTNPKTRYMLLGSAQIMLLKNVRETLVGRGAIKELYPLAFCERLNAAPRPWISSILDLWISGKDPYLPNRKHVREVLGINSKEWKEYLMLGGMPAQFQIEDEEDWKEWLKNYVSLYLQRDLHDLVRINDLTPFRRCEQMIALRSGNILNYSELARDCGISIQTAKNYCSYLELSYQTIRILPYYRNHSKRLMKSPKVYMVDIAIQKVLTGQWGSLTGHQYESFIAGEFKKILLSFHPDWELFHLRTFDGLEVDFLLVNGDRAVAVEVKSSKQVSSQDARHLKNIEAITGITHILKFVIYEGVEVKIIGEKIIGIPSIVFFGPEII